MEPLSSPLKESNNPLNCDGCGAALQYKIGAGNLTCSHCGIENKIKAVGDAGAKSDFRQFITEHSGGTLEQVIIKCGGCRASVSLPPSATSGLCPFCASPLVAAMAGNLRTLRPHSILPFGIERDTAQQHMAKWVKKLWFAPSDIEKGLKESANGLQGIYMPYWCYYTNTCTEYTGKRGTYYYVDEKVTKEVNGKKHTTTKRVRHTDWVKVEGKSMRTFNDILVSASPSLSQDVSDKLEPWDLENSLVFDERFLSGFISETYQIDAEKGLETVKATLEPSIKEAIIQDIGGDEQKLKTYNIGFSYIGLKYILLPVWLCAYQSNNKLYQIAVNARTGEVIGKRPYSIAKIATAVFILLGILMLCTILTPK